jgi:hypothetical protein
MRKSTFEKWIANVRAMARGLAAAFREPVRDFAAQASAGAAVESIMSRLRHVRSAGPSTRDEMNER